MFITTKQSVLNQRILHWNKKQSKRHEKEEGQVSLHWWAHLIDGTGRLLSYLAAACAEDLGEVLASGKKMSNRDFTFVGKSWTQWRVNFTQLISMCLKRDEHNKAHNPQQDSNTSIVLNSIFQSIWLNTRLRINNQLAELFEKMITLFIIL